MLTRCAVLGWGRTAGAALLAGALAGCATGRLYSGPARASGEVALVVTSASASVKVEAIDEARVSPSSDRYEVLPGRHVLGLRLPGAGQASVTVEAEAGHSYRLRASQDAASAKWTPQVDDAGPLQGLATKEHVPELERGCRAGTARECVELGALYERGTADLGWDEGRAAILYQQACGSGEPRSCTRLGVLLQEGRGARKDANRASELFERACGEGEPAACFRLGALAREGRGGGPDFGRAAAMYEKACKGGEAQGCTGLGLLYEDGLGVEHDERRAAGLYTQACEGGSAMGCANLGVLYLLGLGMPRDADRAAALFEKGCAGGAASACAHLAPAPEPVAPPAEPVAAAPSAGSCGEYQLIGSHIPLRVCPEPPRLGVTDLRLGVRGEADLLQRGYAAALWAESSGDGWSVAATAILRLPPGGRLEARLHPLQIGPVRPYLGLGASILFPAVAGRAALGADVRFWRLHVFSEVALEHFFNAGPTFEPNSVLLSVGLGWQL